MVKFRRSVISSVLAAAMAASMALPAFAATTEGFNGLTDETKSVLEGSNALENIPEAVFGLLKDRGGSINLVDSIYHEGEEVYGIYYLKGEDPNRIEVSEKTMRDGFPNMLPYYLAHEVGHFIYFNSDVSQEQENVLQERYERLKPGDVDGRMTVEEVFADGYASYVSNGGYGMTDTEKEMFEAYEDSVVNQYCEAHPDYTAPAETEAEPDYASMPLWKLASYGPAIANKYIQKN